ncbi:purine-cytosine permease [Phanerochaete sordida]|uniref:Purine-cytosine permease n=1 Tax=Phanerochaete sordida TaxID=48140 RepID=A0A9P3LA26_9APHY|nr:purine-cytosine permease [Phanerochaete sordida]
MADRSSSNASFDEKEKGSEVFAGVQEIVQEVPPSKNWFRRNADRFDAWLASRGLEGHGIEPTTEEQRSDTRIFQEFTVWFSGNINVQAFGAASVGPAFFGLGMRTTFLTCVVTDLIASLFPAYCAVFGPKLGTRSMVQSRFSWGYYGAIIPSVLNVLTMQGYLIINCIIGGQTLGVVLPHPSATLGIVITGLISLAVTFCGYQTLHWYEMLCWIPNAVAMIVMLAVNRKTLLSVPVEDPTPASAATILTFAAAIAVTVVAWSPVSPDYGIFHDHKASSMRIFIYAYLGFLLSSVSMHLVGGAFTAAAPYVPEWQAGLGNGNDIGGLIAAVLARAGGFGKFLVVCMALTTPSASTPTMYTVCTSLMTIWHGFEKVPRFLFAIISTAILIPVGIVGATRFYDTFTQILSFIGYWLGPFIAIVLTEHFVFRRRWAAYAVGDAWNVAAHPRLARGYAAVWTLLSSVPLIAVCMSQAWWTGPVAARGTGDIAMIVSFVYSALMYAGARTLELRWTASASR